MFSPGFVNTKLSRFSPYLYDCSSASLPSFSVLLTGLFLGPSFQEFKLLIFLLALLFPVYSQDVPHQNTQSHVSFFSSNPFLFCPNLDPFHLPNENHPAILKSLPKLILQPHLLWLLECSQVIMAVHQSPHLDDPCLSCLYTYCFLHLIEPLTFRFPLSL